MKNCPKPSCDRIIEKNEFTLLNAVSCGCGAEFCFSCEEEKHEPAACVYVKKWIEKEKGGDKDTMTWIKANTKPCPGCKKMIEKNHGCNHMKCS